MTDPAQEAGPRPLAASWHGRVDFDVCLKQQLAARDALTEERGGETLFMVEHPPTLTIGRRGRREDVLWSDDQLESAGMSVCETPRGGEVTLHAPGQLVAYPVVQIGRQIRAHIVCLAEVSMELFAELGVTGCEFRMEHPGVWRGSTKMASIGIHVSRGITVQGISMNLDVEPSMFGALVSCGMPSIEMTSAAHLVEAGLPPIGQLAQRWAEIYARRAGFELDWS